MDGRVKPGHDDWIPYALVPVKGKLPIGPMPISPDMLSPETLPVNSSVSGIGLVMESFQPTLSPFTVPSKISPELPSAPCVPVSVPPALNSRKNTRARRFGLRGEIGYTAIGDPGTIPVRWK